MDFKSILRTFLKIILPLAFGCLLLWFLYRKMDITEIWRVVKEGFVMILFWFLYCSACSPISSVVYGGIADQFLGRAFQDE